MDSGRAKPTKSELAILQVVWAEGEVTVRQVHERLSVHREVGYTTVLKLMQLMVEKGLLLRSEQGKAHLYTASEPPSASRQSLVEDFIEKAFGGSARDLVMHALNAKRTTPEELAEIRELIGKLEEQA
jgi:predicted transcriptional regulator